MRKEKWLDEALHQIRFLPDRKKVRMELEEHMQDRIDEYTGIFEARGMSANEALAAAEEKAVAVMGDPKETGRELNREHKPLLGWLWLGSWILVVVMLCVALGVGIFLCKEMDFVLFQKEYTVDDYDRVRNSYIENHYGENSEDVEYNVQVDYTVEILDTKVTFHNFIYDNAEDNLVIILSSQGPGNTSAICNRIICNGADFNSYFGGIHNEWGTPLKPYVGVMKLEGVNKYDSVLEISYDYYGNSFYFEVDVENGVVKEVQ